MKKVTWTLLAVSLFLMIIVVGCNKGKEGRYSLSPYVDRASLLGEPCDSNSMCKKGLKCIDDICQKPKDDCSAPIDLDDKLDVTCPLNANCLYEIPIKGGSGDFQWSTLGDLPESISLSEDTGTITGTPKTAGTWILPIAVQDVACNTEAMTDVTLEVPVAEPPEEPAAQPRVSLRISKADGAEFKELGEKPSGSVTGRISDLFLIEAVGNEENYTWNITGDTDGICLRTFEGGDNTCKIDTVTKGKERFLYTDVKRRVINALLKLTVTGQNEEAAEWEVQFTYKRYDGDTKITISWRDKNGAWFKDNSSPIRVRPHDLYEIRLDDKEGVARFTWSITRGLTKGSICLDPVLPENVDKCGPSFQGPDVDDKLRYLHIDPSKPHTPPEAPFEVIIRGNDGYEKKIQFVYDYAGGEGLHIYPYGDNGWEPIPILHETDIKHIGPITNMYKLSFVGDGHIWHLTKKAGPMNEANICFRQANPEIQNNQNVCGIEQDVFAPEMYLYFHDIVNDGRLLVLELTMRNQNVEDIVTKRLLLTPPR